MNRLVNCPSCGRTCKIPASAAGKMVKCPHCAAPFAVPSSEAVLSPPAPPVGRPAAPSPAAGPAAVRPGKGVSTGLLLVGAGLAFFALLMAAVGGGLLVWLLTSRAPAPAGNNAGAASPLLVPFQHLKRRRSDGVEITSGHSLKRLEFAPFILTEPDDGFLLDQLDTSFVGRLPSALGMADIAERPLHHPLVRFWPLIVHVRSMTPPVPRIQASIPLTILPDTSVSR